MIPRAQILQREGAALHLVFADDQREPGAQLARGLERLLEAEGFVSQFDNCLGVWTEEGFTQTTSTPASSPAASAAASPSVLERS